MKLKHIIIVLVLYFLTACHSTITNKVAATAKTDSILKPVIVTEPVKYDTDDPAIWIDSSNPAGSIILGTDKAEEGALYAFDLNGKIIADKVVRGLKRPNNVDVEYGLLLNNELVDIAVVTERYTKKIRIFTLPGMKPVDNGGIDMFTGETGTGYRDLMGIALYRSKNGKMYAIVGRKNGPEEGNYLWQYLLHDNGKGVVQADLVRKFGKFSGLKEIEAIAVDDALGYVYYSDEGFGVRKYYADPEKGNDELAVFGATGFKEDHEGISIYASTDSTGYILISDQQANRFHVFTRNGTTGNPHDHQFVRSVYLATNESDGSEVTSIPLNAVFKKGLFVAMSNDRSFQFYRWEDLMP